MPMRFGSRPKSTGPHQLALSAVLVAVLTEVEAEQDGGILVSAALINFQGMPSSPRQRPSPVVVA